MKRKRKVELAFTTCDKVKALLTQYDPQYDHIVVKVNQTKSDKAKAKLDSLFSS